MGSSTSDSFAAGIVPACANDSLVRKDLGTRACQIKGPDVPWRPRQVVLCPLRSSCSQRNALAADIVDRSCLRFTVATDEATRETAYRLRYLTVVDRGWESAATLANGQECDAYDERAVHVIGWNGDTPVATGRIVLPRGPLPTEDFCGFSVEPRGQIADVSQ